MASEQSLLRFDLWMSGCFLWTIAPQTESFFARKLRQAGVKGKPLDEALSECFCTVLGGANAYLDKYCQFENNQQTLVSGRTKPLLIAFCYNQQSHDRKYDFYLLSTEREEMVGNPISESTKTEGEETVPSALLRVYLAKLPDRFSLRIADGKTKGGMLRSVRITNARGKTITHDVPRSEVDDIQLVGELEQRMKAAVHETTSPAAAWLSIRRLSEFQKLFDHIPRSVQDNVRLSVSGSQALAVLQNATRHPADAPVLMQIYAAQQQELKKGNDKLFENFGQAIERVKTEDQRDPSDGRIHPDLMPRSILLGQVCEIENRHEVSVEFEVPSGDRFVETFERNRLKSINADYFGAQVKYIVYEKGSWRASAFALRRPQSVTMGLKASATSPPK